MNRQTRRILVTLAASLTMAVGLASCTTTQTAGRRIDDGTIRAAVKARLTADRFSNQGKIRFDVTNGVVTLAGNVPNAAVAVEAQSEVRKISGVVRVINYLQVKSPSAA